jgi:hypothetical protein
MIFGWGVGRLRSSTVAVRVSCGFEDVTVVKLDLTKDEARILHDEISGMGLTYHEIPELAK